MDLTSAQPFWRLQNGLINTYPPIVQDVRCDVAVIGAGITGAMVAYRLSKMGKRVVVLDRRDACFGSTSATTGLLLYEIDVPLVELAKLIGQRDAELAYQLSYESIDRIRSLVAEVDADCDFENKTSIYLADSPAAASMLQAEAAARQSIGLQVEYLSAGEVRERYGLEGPAALATTQAGSCDAYQFAHALLQRAICNGAAVYDRTEAESFEPGDRHVTMRTNRGFRVVADSVVVAAGYESQSMLAEDIVELNTTYALVSQPLASVAPWNRDWMMWETKDPYLYLRCTADNRLLVGGEDDDFHDPVQRDLNLDVRVREIERKVRALIPDLDWEVEHAWAGTFGKTHDGLAYIGRSPEHPQMLFACGFGGNGITFSSIASDLIANTLCGGPPDPREHLFRFGR